MNETTTTKEVGYAYPSSPHAIKAGFNKQGCYTVVLYRDLASVLQRGFKTSGEAFDYAETLPYSYSRYSLVRGVNIKSISQN